MQGYVVEERPEEVIAEAVVEKVTQLGGEEYRDGPEGFELLYDRSSNLCGLHSTSWPPDPQALHIRTSQRTYQSTHR